MEDFVFFSSDDWGWKTSKYHLAKGFAKYGRVIFVNSIGLRAPKLATKDAKRMFSKLRGFIKGASKVAPNIYVLSPVIVPFHNFPFRQRINQHLLTYWLKYWFHRLTIHKPYVFIFSPNWAENIQPFEDLCKKLVYYCVDDQAAFRGVPREYLQELETTLLKKADFVFSTSTTLHKKNSNFNPNCHYLPHGVNYLHFSAALDSDTTIPDDLLQIPQPRIGFWGHISYDWIDISLLKYVARKRPDYSLVLIGKLDIEKNEFEQYPNIYLIGERDYANLPSYAKGFDMAMIPFNRNKLTYFCNPLKLYEYFCAGLPVVSTNLPEVERFREHVSIAKDMESFVNAITSCLNKARPCYKLSNMMKTETWDERVRNILDIIRS